MKGKDRVKKGDWIVIEKQTRSFSIDPSVSSMVYNRFILCRVASASRNGQCRKVEEWNGAHPSDLKRLGFPNVWTLPAEYQKAAVLEIAFSNAGTEGVVLGKDRDEAIAYLRHLVEAKETT